MDGDHGLFAKLAIFCYLYMIIVHFLHVVIVKMNRLIICR